VTRGLTRRPGNLRLRECVDVMRALFAGETVSHDGLVRVDRAKLHTLPRQSPPLIGPAISVDTARWVGEWADGLATVNQPRAKLAEMIDAFRSNGGEGKRLVLQVHLSWAPSEEEALRLAHEQWRTNVFPPPTCWDLEWSRTSTARPRPSPPSRCATSC
jgi:alkanesulfonate monooxygenase SsuD/methylene tetrahydromethanopterin reductase-like flavin-dependent oxidoreductase (luciferase family)